MTRRWNILVASFLAATAGALFLPPHQVVFIVLLTLATASFAVAITALFRTGRLSWLLVALTFTQLILFARIHWMIYTVLGPQHYTCTVPPQWYHWLQLIAAHVARAIDILDALEDYKINLQAIRNASALAGWLLVSLHVMVDIFIIGAVVQTVSRVFNNDREVRGRQGGWA